MIGLILAAAGAGSRLGSAIPKQFLPLDGTPVYLRALQPFASRISEAVVVVPSGWSQRVEDEMRSFSARFQWIVETGGTERQDSVGRGLARLSPDIEIVLVHDAARPFVAPELIDRVIAGTRRTGACIPGLPPKETVKLVRDEEVAGTIDRNSLILVQTPQAYRRQLLRDAFEKACADRYYGTDEAVLLERLGVPVAVVAGDPANVKITWKQDLEGFR